MKIVTVDDHALIREGLKAILMSTDERPAVVEAADGGGLRQQLAAHPDIDLILLDVQLPDCDGLALLEELARTHPQVPVIVLSAEHEAETITRALHMGAAGFVPKTSINKVLISAIRLVLAGGIYVPPEAVLQGRSISRPEGAAVPRADRETVAVLPEVRTHHRSDRPLSTLTERQWEASGRSCANSARARGRRRSSSPAGSESSVRFIPSRNRRPSRRCTGFFLRRRWRRSS